MLASQREEKRIRKHFDSTIITESYGGYKEERSRNFLIDVKTQNDMDTIEEYFKENGFEVSVFPDGFENYIGYVDVFMDNSYVSVSDFKEDVNYFYKKMKKEMK